MSRHDGLLATICVPSFAELLDDARSWLKTQGLWWATSVTAHALILSGVLLFMGTIAEPIVNQAHTFVLQLDTTVPDPVNDRIQLTNPSLKMKEDEEELQLPEEPPIDIARDRQFDVAAEFAVAALDTGTPGPSVGLPSGLEGLNVKALSARSESLGRNGANSSIGGNHNPQQNFHQRENALHKNRIGPVGDTPKTKGSVEAALRWLARHQQPNGAWTLDNYPRLCKDGACSGTGIKADTAATALGLLPFLGAGQTHHRKGIYQKHLHAGLAWLVSHQKNDGDLRGNGGNMYAHGLSTICLCEAYGLSGDKQIGAAAQQAINFVVAAQDSVGGGWRYEPRQPGDTSVVGWQVMALKSGLMAGLSVPSATLERAAQFLTAVGDGRGSFGYTEKGAGLATSAAGMLCSQYMGASKTSPAIQQGMKILLANLADRHASNCYYYYYATQVMHNVPGAEWDVWNRVMRKQLVESQIKAGCAAGSWDPQADAFGKESGGRIMVTALNALTLEVYYRYLPLYQLDGRTLKK
jgi:hypothetical protein